MLIDNLIDSSIATTISDRVDDATATINHLRTIDANEDDQCIPESDQSSQRQSIDEYAEEEADIASKTHIYNELVFQFWNQQQPQSTIILFNKMTLIVDQISIYIRH